VLLLGHYDTVWPVGTRCEIPWQVQKTSSGDRATGPGCLDMKAGLVQIFHALSLLPQRESLCVLITGDEELGSPTSRELIESEARRASATLVLEPAGPAGAVKLERKGVSIYDVEIRGRAAHSGLAPELGVNAGIELAHQILRVSDLGDAAVGTTVVPTVLSAGTSRNTVPAVARLAVDARFWRVDELRRIDVAMGSLGPVLAEAHVDVRGGVNRPPMEATSSALLFRLAQEVSAALGLAPPAGCRVGGASDGNLAAAAGSLTLDGLGAVGDGAHARDEYVEVGAMADRSALLCALVPAIQDSVDFGSRHA
jgi:glutamate carboxypeptidase